MERLWSPWRMEYVGGSGDTEACVFCDQLARRDDDAARNL